MIINNKVYQGVFDSAYQLSRPCDSPVYIQVCESMASDDTRIRELKPLLAIRDNFPKYIIVGNPMYVGNYEGIECMYIGDFLSFY